MSKCNNTHIILSRKIQLRINDPDKAARDNHWQTLRQWQYNCFRAANYIIAHQYIQEQIADIVYITFDIQAKLADIQKDSDGILTTSRHNTTYQLLAKLFKGIMPMHILSCLNHMLVSQFNKEKQTYRQGEKSLRNYKKDIAIPFKKEDLRHWQYIETTREFACSLFGVPLRTYTGNDYGDKKRLLEQLINGQIELCNSGIQLEGEKLFLLASFRQPVQEPSLDESVIAEASLSIENPLILKIGSKRYAIGSREAFLYRRLAMQQARQRITKAVQFHKGGHGRTRKFKKLGSFKDLEYNYVQQQLHVYSRRLVDLCVQHGAGTLILTSQGDKEAVAREDPFLLRNWSYAALKEKISYKARQAGLMLIVE